MEPSADRVAAVLQAAASRNYQESQHAAQQLEDWHRSKGFHTALQDIYLEQSAPPELRLVALTQLKNGVEKHWKRGANYALTQPEQEHIRKRLFQGIFDNASITSFASFQAIIIAKVARNDFPDAWPSLFQDLVSLLDSPHCSDFVRQNLILTIIRYVIKEFATVRMTKPRRAFYDAAPTLMQELASRCAHLLKAFVQDPGANSIQGLQSVNYLKCIRRLAVFGYENPHRDPAVQQIWSTSVQTQQGVLDFILGHRLVDPFSGTFPALLAQLTKLHMTMSALHPVSFSLFNGTPDLSRLYWHSALAMQSLQLDGGRMIDGISATVKYSEEHDMIRAFEHKALTLLRSCFKIAFGTLPIIKFRASDEDKKEPEDAKRIMKHELLTADAVQGMMRQLINSFLIYDAESLQQWEDEPEEWEASQSEQDDSFDVSPRQCAERLLMDLTLHHKEVAIPLLTQLVRDAHDLRFTDKESIYSALAATAAIVGTSFDFNGFLNDRLLSELRSQGPGHALLLYRTPTLLARWVPVNVSDENKSLVYSIFAGLLKNDDLAIRIAAGKRFYDVCNDFGFSADAFSPHAAEMFTSIIRIFDDVSLPETILALLETVGAMIERMENSILPFADTLIQLLGPLWQKLEKEQQMKKSVVSVLTKFVNALGLQAAPIQPLVLPMIHGALEPGSETQLYLLEDALDLLHSLVDNSRDSSPGLTQLVGLLLPTLEMETNIAQKGLDILYMYLLLDPGFMLQEQNRQNTLKAMTPLLTTKSNDLVKLTVEFIEAMIYQASLLDLRGVRAVIGDLESQGFLTRILTSLHDCWQAHMTTGPNRKEAPFDARNETFYFTILSRMIIADLDTFNDSVHRFAQHAGVDPSKLLAYVLDEWYSHLDNVSLPGTRKAMIIALSSLLKTKNDVVLVRLQQLVSAWTSLLMELRDPPEDPLSDSMVVPESSKAAWEGDSEHWKRRKAMSYADAVHSVSLPIFVRQALLQTISDNGGDERFQQQWLVNVDKEVLAEFQGLGIF